MKKIINLFFFSSNFKGENKRLLAGKALYLVRYLTMSKDEFLEGPYVSDLLIGEEKLVLLNAIHNGCIDQEHFMYDEQTADQILISENGTINLDDFDLKQTQTLNHDLQWLLSETKMNVKRKYSRPTCLVAPNRINLSNNHTLLDELNNDKNNNSQQFGINSSGNGTIKKKSKHKKLLNGIGDFIICFIQLLD